MSKQVVAGLRVTRGDLHSVYHKGKHSSAIKQGQKKKRKKKKSGITWPSNIIICIYDRKQTICIFGKQSVSDEINAFKGMMPSILPFEYKKNLDEKFPLI